MLIEDCCIDWLSKVNTALGLPGAIDSRSNYELLDGDRFECPDCGREWVNSIENNGWVANG